MKSLFSVLLVVGALMFTQKANAALCNLVSCATTITSDSGLSQNCQDTTYGCGCVAYARSLAMCFGTISATSPGTGYSNIATAVGTGMYCWAKSAGCKATLEGSESVEQVTSGAGNIEEAMSPNMASEFYGWQNGVLRSPNVGRAQSANARLDVCIGSGDTDSAIATNNATTCYNQYCGTSYNEYCNFNSAAVCQDRCECAINGQTHSSCNQL